MSYTLAACLGAITYQLLVWATHRLTLLAVGIEPKAWADRGVIIYLLARGEAVASIAARRGVSTASVEALDKIGSVRLGIRR